jgi:hypothetical protein
MSSATATVQPDSNTERHVNCYTAAMDSVVTVRLAASAQPFVLDADAISWAGYACPAADAPLLFVQIANFGLGAKLHSALARRDIVGVDKAVFQMGLPLGFLVALAERCHLLDAIQARCIIDGQLGIDPRFRTAMQLAAPSTESAAQAAGFIEPNVLYQPRSKHRVCEAQALANGCFAILESPEYDHMGSFRLVWLAADGAQRVAYEQLRNHHEQHQWRLLTPTACGDKSRVLLAIRNNTTDGLALHYFDDHGSALRSYFVRAQGDFEEYSLGENSLWLHGYSQVAFDISDPQYAIELLPAMPTRVPPAPKFTITLPWSTRAPRWAPQGGNVGDMFACISQRQHPPGASENAHKIILCDRSLARDYSHIAEEVTGPIHRQCIDGDSLWLATAKGLFQCTASSIANWAVVQRGCLAVHVSMGNIYFAFATGANEVVCVDRITKQERFRATLSHRPHAIYTAPNGGIFVHDSSQWTWLNDAGEILFTSSKPHSFAEFSVAVVADGTTAVAMAGDMRIIGADDISRSMEDAEFLPLQNRILSLAASMATTWMPSLSACVLSTRRDEKFQLFAFRAQTQRTTTCRQTTSRQLYLQRESAPRQRGG